MDRMTLRDATVVLVAVLPVVSLMLVGGGPLPAAVGIALAADTTETIVEDFEDSTSEGWYGDQTVVEKSFEDNYSIRIDAGEDTSRDVTANTADFYAKFRVRANNSNPHNIDLGPQTDDNVFVQIDPSSSELLCVNHNGNCASSTNYEWYSSGWREVEVWTNGSTSSNDDPWVFFRFSDPGQDKTGYDVRLEWNKSVDWADPVTYNVHANTNGGSVFVDEWTLAEDEPGVLSGAVTNTTDEAIANATVTAKQNGSVIDNTTTDSNGNYSLTLASGTYNVTADHENYHPETHTVTVDSDGGNQSFSLTARDRSLVLDTDRLVKHGETTSYTVWYFETDNQTGELERENVTVQSNVTSNNTAALSVDSTNYRLTATENESVNVIVAVKAEYTRDNTTHTDIVNVTVAKVTLENIKILPGAYRISGTFSGDPDGKSNPMLAILIATLVGIVGARASTSFGGLSLMAMAIIVSWFGGFLTTGIMLVAVFTATFLGLNVAANIDYSVHK